MTSSGGAGCSRSHSFSGISSAAATGGAGADVFVRAADNEMYVRADKIDLKNLDVQFDKTRSKVWLEQHRSSSAASPLPLLEWEIDLAKLDIQNQVAHGTFGVVYRGTYDGHDVAVMVSFCCFPYHYWTLGFASRRPAGCENRNRGEP
uniref:Protein kinase domain-containing protein n=1 Tax=Oryza barthii TaxID=65489 RepID=A0A0D3FP00_9ORYZ